jgi:hypothetical protein
LVEEMQTVRVKTDVLEHKKNPAVSGEITFESPLRLKPTARDGGDARALPGVKPAKEASSKSCEENMYA